MKRRIYWLMPDLASARRTMRDLLQARVEAAHIHFAGPQDIDMSGLHAANIWQTSDVVQAAQWGMVVGAAVGSIAGLGAALLFPVVGDAPQWEIAAILAVAGRTGRRLVVQHDRHFHPEQTPAALRRCHRRRGRSC